MLGGVSAREEIARLEQELMDAVQRRDMDWLEERLGEEFALTTGRPGHETRSRDEWLRITRDDYVIHSFDFGELEVLDYGEAAVARSRYSQRARMGEAERSGAYLMTDVWVRRDGDWRIVTRHISPVQDRELRRRPG
jgi:ketosteroid isomerase-like protein